MIIRIVISGALNQTMDSMQPVIWKYDLQKGTKEMFIYPQMVAWDLYQSEKQNRITRTLIQNHPLFRKANSIIIGMTSISETAV